MVKFKIINNIIYDANISKGEKIIEIPNGVLRIKKICITRDVEKIIIPKSVEIIDLDAFEYAINLREIILIDNDNFIVEKKCLYNNKKTIIYLVERDITNSFNTPSQVRYISAHAFAHCSFLKSIKLNQNIKYIGAFAFIECFNLIKINIPTINEIDLQEATFEGCNSLKEIVIPRNIKSLGKCLFYECDSLERIIIDTNQIKIIPMQCFAYCERLLNIDFKEGIKEIKENAFMGCKLLERISLPKSVNKIGLNVFLDVENVTIESESNFVIDYCIDNKISYAIN
ncbi:MAG: leucine-rich repeat domain-containing protein [Acholeplasmatales bacterium]|nr:leucine-rich repeat domain-containing protein [Acholeplasmatales bacterium]